MATSIYKPSPELIPYIEAYVISYAAPSNEPLCLYPSNLPLLCFDLTKQHFRAVGSEDRFNFLMGMVGVLDHLTYLDKIPKKSIQVFFKPYGAYRLFSTPMNLFVNQGIDLLTIAPTIKACLNQLQDHGDEDVESIKILDQFLTARLKATPGPNGNFKRIQFACEAIKNSPSTLNIRRLCQKVGMSETRFRIHFKEKIGISPKKFSQIETFQQIKSYLTQHPDINWMDLVVNHSFYDQTHFIKNFKWFFGCTPSAYLKQGMPLNVNHH